MPHTPFGRPPPLGVFAVILAIAACAPTAALHVSQNGVCKGYQVTIVWEGTGDRFELQSAPINALVPSSTQSVERSESLTEPMTVGTQFRLAAFRSHDEKRSDWQPVQVLDGHSGHQFFVDVNGCVDSIVTATHPDPSLSAANRSYAANVWGGILIDRVALESGDWHVEHSGRVADLHKGTESPVFRGAPMNGEWLFRMTLPVGATCDQAPTRVVIDVYPQCP